MPRTRTITETVYRFSELAPEVQAKVLDTERHITAEFFAQDLELEPITTAAKLIGIDFATHPVRLGNGQTRYDPSIWWALHERGAGATFDGDYHARPDTLAAIKGEFGTDAALHAIAAALDAAPAGVSARVKASRSATHYRATQIDVYDIDGQDITATRAGADVMNAIRDFMVWIHDTIAAEYDDRTSDATLREVLNDTDREFFANGKPAGQDADR